MRRFSRSRLYKKKLRKISLYVLVYVLSALMLYDMRHPNLPALADLFVEYFTFPLRWMFRPLYPLLKPFGMVVSDGAELPTPYGIIAGAFIYILAIFVISLLFEPAREKLRFQDEEFWEG